MVTSVLAHQLLVLLDQLHQQQVHHDLLPQVPTT